MEKRFIFCRIISVMLILVFVSTPLWASMVIYKDLDERIQESEKIVRAKVTAMKSEWTADHNTIYTLVTFVPSEAIKGVASAAEFTLRFEGGRVGDDVIKVVEMPEFEIGKEYILFVASSGENRLCPIVGWGDGTLRIEKDQATGKEFLLNGSGRKILSIGEKEMVVEELGEAPARPVPVVVGGTTKTTLMTPQAASQTTTLAPLEASQFIQQIKNKVATIKPGETAATDTITKTQDAVDKEVY